MYWRCPARDTDDCDPLMCPSGRPRVLRHQAFQQTPTATALGRMIIIVSKVSAIKRPARYRAMPLCHQPCEHTGQEPQGPASRPRSSQAVTGCCGQERKQTGDRQAASHKYTCRPGFGPQSKLGLLGHEDQNGPRIDEPDHHRFRPETHDKTEVQKARIVPCFEKDPGND